MITCGRGSGVIDALVMDPRIDEEPAEDLLGVIGAAVVHNHQFPELVGLSHHRLHRLGDNVRPLPGGQHHAHHQVAARRRVHAGESEQGGRIRGRLSQSRHTLCERSQLTLHADHVGLLSPPIIGGTVETMAHRLGLPQQVAKPALQPQGRPKEPNR